MEMFEANLEALMLSKSFDDLTEQERTYVLTHVTEAAYRNYRLVLSSSADLLGKDGAELLPDAGIPGNLKTHFDAKFGSAPKVPFGILPSLVLRRAVAFAGIAAVVVICFFIVTKEGKEVNFEKPKQSFTISAPLDVAPVSIAPVSIAPVKIAGVELQEKPVEVRPRVRTLVKAKIKSPPGAPVIALEKDIVVNDNSEMLGLYVYEPLLCLDIDVNKIVPGLRD